MTLHCITQQQGDRDLAVSSDIRVHGVRKTARVVAIPLLVEYSVVVEVEVEGHTSVIVIEVIITDIDAQDSWREVTRRDYARHGHQFAELIGEANRACISALCFAVLEHYALLQGKYDKWGDIRL